MGSILHATVVLAHYVKDTILSFDFMTKCHYETSYRLDSMVICYGWLTWLG